MRKAKQKKQIRRKINEQLERNGRTPSQIKRINKKINKGIA